MCGLLFRINPLLWIREERVGNLEMWGDLGFFGRRNKQDAIKRLAIKSGGESQGCGLWTWGVPFIAIGLIELTAVSSGWWFFSECVKFKVTLIYLSGDTEEVSWTSESGDWNLGARSTQQVFGLGWMRTCNGEKCEKKRYGTELEGMTASMKILI